MAEVVPLAAKQPAQPAPAKSGAQSEDLKAAPTIRVDLDRVDRLINLVGELVINQAMLSQRVLEAGLARASAVAMGLDELEQLTREIQDSVMAIRAQPVKSVFQRMPRLVREIAAMTGKSVRLVTDGEGTEVDKTVIERLTDPLTHMIRNAIDHGVESPEKRIAAGKAEEGLVRLSAQHRSGRIVIEVSDDGAGINRPRVKEIAVEKGLIAADAVLSDEETDNLIFLPGFSTAQEISDISGRGVGMDVVKRSIQALGGRIAISSRPGQGSTFTMSLPLTLAVLDGMVVTVAQQTLVVPLTAIVETLQPKAADVHSMGGNARVISIRNKFTPLIDVGRELSYRNTPADPLASVALLVETEGGGRSALLGRCHPRPAASRHQEFGGQLPACPRHRRRDNSRRWPRRAHCRCRCGRCEFACRGGRARQCFGSGGVTAMNESRIEAMNGRELMAFRIGAQEFCVDIMAVREIRGFAPATPLPQSPAFVRGVINLRGAVLPIIDLSARLGFPPAEPTARHVIMVVQVGNQTVGLLVDAVSDILTVGAESIQPTPDVASEMTKSFVRGVLAIDGRMISLIALDNVLPAMESEAA